MILECISTVCVSGIVILGLLIMTQVITLEEVAGTIGRLFGLVVVVLVSLCLLRVLVAAIIVPWLVSLKATFLWIAIVLTIVIILAVVVRIAIFRFLNRRPSQ